MKITVRLLLGLFFIGLIACEPKIITNITYQETPLQSETEILVIGVELGYPDDYEEVGLIEIKDAGLSNNCRYDRVISMAKKYSIPVIRFPRENLNRTMIYNFGFLSRLCKLRHRTFALKRTIFLI